MLRPRRLNCAGLSAVLTGLLAVTALTLGAPQAQAQKSTAQPIKTVKAGPIATLTPTITPLAVLNGEVNRVSHYNPEQKLRLVLAIQPPHMAEEEQFINELVTKGSPNFHKFLTPEQWNERFAPSVEDEQKVVGWAQSQGLTVVQRYPNRLLVAVDGTAGAIENAFHVTINNYQVGDEVDFSNDRDPVIPDSLLGIVHSVLGLNSVERVHRIGSRKPTVKGADYVPGPMVSELAHSQGNGDPKMSPANRATTENSSKSTSKATPSDSYPLDYKGGYAMDPDNVQSSQGYDFNALQRLSHCCNEWGDSSGSPPESSIALVGYGNYNYSDATTFFSAYGMAWNLSGWCIGGGSCPGVDDEAPLDVEYSGAMANNWGDWHGTARVIEYEMTNNYYSTYAADFNQILSDGYAKVVSTSYGWEENVGFSGSVATGTMHPIFNNMVGVGITLIASSGDSGASAGCNGTTRALYPATDPDFIAAGGTQLSLDTNGIFQSENAWEGEFWSGACGSNHGGGTGGVSVLFIAPSWQATQESPYYGWQGGTAYDGTEYVFTGGNGRVVPDISLTANPDVLGQWDYSGGGWGDSGGTSIVAPELAGFFAQENSYLDYVGNKCGGGTSACSPVGNAAPFIYYNGNDGAPHDPFYDITNGCTSNDITVAYDLVYWCAYSGYDLATGWGSVNMLQLAWGINWELIPAYGQPSIAFSGPATSTWFNTDKIVGWTVTDAGSGGYPAPGVAGFTQGWDSIPSDPYSEPHGGDGNSFYWGPEYPFASGGCLSFNGLGGCAGGSGQGCHTAWVEAWDNQGRNATSSYGSVCFDNVAPTISISNSPGPNSAGWWKTSVQVTLSPYDATSGVKSTFYAFDTGSCYPGSYGPCSTYSGPFTYSSEGANYIYYFTEDNAGNFSSEPYEWIYIDKTPPVTTATLTGTIYSGSTYSSPVKVTLSASDTNGALYVSGVKSTFYKLDGASAIHYTGAFTVSALGSHTVVFSSTDYAGNAEKNKTVTFTVKAVPQITWATPAAITYPTALSSTQLNATANVAGTFVYTPAAGTVLSGGWHTLSLTFTPTDTADYIPTTVVRGQLVNKAAPTITWATPAAITYGTPLSSTQLDAVVTGVDGNVLAGTTTYTPAAGTVLSAGTRTLWVSFTPTDSTDYKAVSKYVKLTVNKATPTLKWPTPAAITYGTPLSSTQLDATANVPGTFAYTPAAGTVLPGGGWTILSVTFTPTDTTDYTTATTTRGQLVNKAVPTITWPTPAPISQGTPLSSTQLDAVVKGVDGNVLAGTSTYNPAAGTVLSSGTHTLKVTFIPTDTTDYQQNTATVSITVN